MRPGTGPTIIAVRVFVRPQSASPVKRIGTTISFRPFRGFAKHLRSLPAVTSSTVISVPDVRCARVVTAMLTTTYAEACRPRWLLATAASLGSLPPVTPLGHGPYRARCRRCCLREGRQVSRFLWQMRLIPRTVRPGAKSENSNGLAISIRLPIRRLFCREVSKRRRLVLRARACQIANPAPVTWRHDVGRAARLKVRSARLAQFGFNFFGRLAPFGIAHAGPNFSAPTMRPAMHHCRTRCADTRHFFATSSTVNMKTERTGVFFI